MSDGDSEVFVHLSAALLTVPEGNSLVSIATCTNESSS